MRLIAVSSLYLRIIKPGGNNGLGKITSSGGGRDDITFVLYLFAVGKVFMYEIIYYSAREFKYDLKKARAIAMIHAFV
jgi:hypothetical protein